MVTTEDVRRYWDARPCNSRHSQSTDMLTYSREVTTRRYIVERHIRPFMDPTRWRGKHVLDLGCGIGTDTLTFARHGAHVTAVDLSTESIKILRQREEAEHLNVSSYALDIQRLPTFLRLGLFDLVWCFGVLHHTVNPEGVLLGARDALRKGGELRMMLYHRCSWRTAEILLAEHDPRLWDIDRIVARRSEAQLDCPITRTTSIRQATHLLTDSGFAVVDARYDHIFPYDVSRYRAGYLVRRPLFRAMNEPTYAWLRRHFGWHTLITAVAL